MGKRPKIVTAASAEALKPVKGQQVDYPDAKVPGLSLRVTPAGKKSWAVRYRTKEGAQRRLTIGSYPAIGLKDAREGAQDAIWAATHGADPARQKQTTRAAAKSRKVTTVADLIEAYLDAAERGRHRPNSAPKRKSTLDLERDYFARLIRPKLGSIEVGTLSRIDVQRLLNDAAKRSEAGARHCRNLIRQAYNYAIREELAARNPAQLVTLARPISRERVLSDAEMKTVWNTLKDPRGVANLMLGPGTALALQLALVTLQRGGEVVGLHAREIDREGKLWTIPGERTKNHRTHAVPLSPLALELIGEAYRLAGSPADQWKGFAFPSPRGKVAMTRHALSRAMSRIATGAKIDDVTPHDFRRTGSTNITGERIGMPRFIVSRVLNQLSDTGGAAAVTGVYDRNEYLPEKRKALDAWAALLAEIVAGKERASNVVKLAG